MKYRISCFLLALLVLFSVCACTDRGEFLPEAGPSPLAVPTTDPSSRAPEGAERIGISDALSDAPTFSATTTAECAVSSLRASVPGGQWYSADTSRIYADSNAKKGERYLTLVLSEEADVQGVSVRWYQGGLTAEDIRTEKDRTYMFYVLASRDGQNWNSLYPGDHLETGRFAESKTTGEFELYEALFEGARYLRIGGYGSYGDANEEDGKYFAIRDVEVFGRGTGQKGGSVDEVDPFEPLTVKRLPIELGALPPLEWLSEAQEDEILRDYEAYLLKTYESEGALSADVALRSYWGISRGRIGVYLDADLEFAPGSTGWSSACVLLNDSVCGMNFQYAADADYDFSGLYYEGKFYKMQEAVASGIATVEDVALFYHYMTEEQGRAAEGADLYPNARQRTVVYFVRHGKSDYTVSTNATAHLNERGYVQAEAIAEYFEHREIDLIVSSPYQRCLDTVAPLAARLETEVIENAYLYERTIGSEVETAPKGFASAQWSDYSYKLEGGESLFEVEERMLKGLEQIFALSGPRGARFECEEGDTILVSTHAAALSVLLNAYDPSLGEAAYNRILSMGTPCVKCIFEGDRCVRMEWIDIPV